VSDIFREVEEDVRREHFEKLWKQYGDYVIALVAVVIIAVAGYELWQRYENQQRLQASATFNAAEQLAESGNSAVAAQTYAKLAQDSSGGYASLARLAQANTLLAAGNNSEAVAIYESIADKDKTLLGDVARIRAAWATVETTPKSELQTLLAPLTDPASAWRFMAHEILAYSDYHAGRFKDAQTEFQRLGSESEAPDALRSRAMAMSMLLKTGGDVNSGTVPPPPAAGNAKGPAPK
jgi:hypothetical protein